MSAKRKGLHQAASTSQDETGSPASKRRKFSELEVETAESTTQTGFELLNQLRKSRDKQGRQISTHFEQLPDPDVIPEYYDEIALPIALDTLHERLERRGYENISVLESDVKRMVSNAKSFNHKSSDIYSDAEKVRKLVSNFMTERNPAYANKNYQATATPIPSDWRPPSRRPLDKSHVDATPQAVEAKKAEPINDLGGRRSSRNVAHSPSEAETQASSTPAIHDSAGVEDTGEAFDGNTFQQAQEKIVSGMMNLTDDDDRLVSSNFIQLPSRNLVDYFQIIKHPVSLKSLRKQVLGAKGHAAATGKTTLKSWKAFEEETSYIWRNAREYNEDGSDIVQMADHLKEYFYERLAEAKAAVTEPPQPRVKLTMGGKTPEPPPKITLKFQRPSNTEGISVDNEALKRQQDLVKAGMDGQKPKQVPARPVPDRIRSGSINSTSANGIKREAAPSHSPGIAPTQVNGVNHSTMAPPVSLNTSHSKGVTQPQAPAPVQTPPVQTYSSSNFNSRFRQLGKDASDALIKNLNISSHPESKIPQRLNMNINASEKLTHQSLTVPLPARQNYLRLSPNLSSTLMQRPSKTLVTCNNRRLQPLALRDPDQLRPVYDCMLTSALNMIEIEVIAGLPRGAVRTGSETDIENEKVTIFAYLQQA